jgi:RNA polymerase sigma factor (sigma-70 family)
MGELPVTRTDERLVDQISAGDGGALDEVYQRHGTACYRLARQVTANPTLAEDCVQEVFLALWRRPESYAATRGGLGGWLLGLTHHKAVDAVRRETAQQRRAAADAARRIVTEAPERTDPAAAAAVGERARAVRAELGRLPAAQREAIGLAYFGGYTQREIAGLTGVPLGTVKTRMLAGMRRLRDTLTGPMAGQECGP